MDGIRSEEIRESLSTEKNRKSVFKAKESAGKSGSFFFFSFDRKFIIKTMNENEKAVFVKALPSYLMHLRNNQNSLIARIYGVFTVEMEDISPVHLLLMANCARSGSEIENVFDLKGSVINREVKHYSPGDCLKDINLIQIAVEKKFLNWQREDMRVIMQQMLADIIFLCAHNLMDYSLLLIIERNPDWEVVSKQRAILRKQTLQARKATLKQMKDKTEESLNSTDLSAFGITEQSMDLSAISPNLLKT